MANTFKSYQSTNITTETTVFTGPASTQTTVIGFSIANTSSETVFVDAKLNSAFMIKQAPIAVGGTLVLVGGDQKVVIEPSSTLKVASSDSVDVIISTLEIS